MRGVARGVALGGQISGAAESDMVSEGKKKRLGRGLAALIGDELSEDSAIEQAREFRRLPVEFLAPNPDNPRKAFSEQDLSGLSDSIRKKGLLQPIVVRHADADQDSYEIVAGERRWRAAQKAGLHDVPVVVRDVSDAEALEIAIVENVQRTDLNPVEEADGYQKLIDQFGYTQQQLAGVIGKSRSQIANILRLLKLPETVKSYLREGTLSAGHARALLSGDRPDELAQQIIKGGLSVRDAERLGRPRVKKNGKASPSQSKDPDSVQLERNLTEALGLSVVLNDVPGRGGTLKIRYKTLEQLDDICARLMRPK